MDAAENSGQRESGDGSSPETRTTLSDGRAVTSRELASVVYEDLQRMAHGLFRAESRELTLQPTALVHEAFLRLVDQNAEQGWKNHDQFLAVAATSMRRVLTQAARDRRSLKRGGGLDRVTLTGNDPGSDDASIDLLDLDDALDYLAAIKERYARIVELRYFAGLSIAETARVLEVSPTIIDREWSKIRAHLAGRLQR